MAIIQENFEKKKFKQKKKNQSKQNVYIYFYLKEFFVIFVFSNKK